ncbi:hypothetical protein BY996DRAFT_6874961 [Phakopsora pachyrhizi]|nr:hypothetical protein BY996DRAFT_6874961 [Phakopsora pachyrhizi]
MAKLGGAKMGFGIPPPLVPKPAPVVQDPVSVLQSENLATESSQTSLPPERIALPPMPKRAGPPRRKTPVPTPTGQEANQRMEEYQKSQDDILTPPQLVKNLENPVEQGSPSGRPGPLEIDQEHLEEKIHDQNKKYSEDDDHHKSDQKNIGPPSDKSDSPKIEKFEPPIQEDQSSAPVHEQLLSSNTNDRNQLVGASHTYAVTEGSVRPNSQEEVTNEDHPEIDSRTLDMCSNEEGTLAEVHEKGQEFESEMRTEENNVDKPQVRSYLEESDLSKQLDDSVETEEKSGNLDALTNQPEYSDMKNDKHAPAAPPRRPLPPTLGAVHHDDGRQLEFPEEAEESLADEKSPSRVKTMLAGSMGLPPLSPRPNTRKPSGPREPKSPLTSIQKEDEIDKQSTVPRDLEASSAENVAVVSSDYHAQPDPHLIMDEETPSEYQKKPDSMDSKRLETENEETRTERVEDCEANDYEEEDEETSRRRRLAERMAKMGGRSMMGPMFSPVGSGSPPARRPSSNRAPPQLASQSTSYSPTIRKLPSPPRKPPPPRLPSSDSLPVASINLPPLPRSAPPPANPDLTFDKSEETEYEVQPPPPVPPKRPSQVRTLSNFENPPSTSSSSPPPASPSVRPSIPFGYQDALRRSNTRSQSNSSGLEERVLSHQKELEERGRELIDGSPPQPPPQPKRSLPSLPPGVPASSGYTQHNEDKESPSHPSRSGSFESSRSGNRRRSGLNEQQDLKTGQSPGGASRFAKPTAEALLPEVSYSSSRMGFKARDLDLASERWWRHRPVAPPSSVSSMKDVLVRLQGSSTLQKGKSIYQYELVVIRDDYSKTIVNIKFDDNDDESGTEMNQLHYPPPEPYDISALQELGQTLGPQIVARAKAKEDEKGFKGEEDGASLVKTIVRSLEVALEPVGQTYGEVVYKCEIQDVKGAHPEIEVKDDIRPGDIVASYGATFKGKGIGHGSMNLGTVSNPHLGIVAEHDVKKNKFKAYGIFHGKVELISYRLDEMKSGCIKVFRVLDKDFLEN